MRDVVFLYPGQSSHDEEMFQRLSAASSASCDRVLSEVGTRLGRELDLSFQHNRDVQLAVFAANQAYDGLLRDAGIEPVASAGLSLGEYSHLVAIGALDTKPAFDLVAARGAAYDSGPDGVMAAVQPLSAADADKLVETVLSEQQWSPNELAVANDNSPTQCVVAGSSEAVDMFIDLAGIAHYTTGTIFERRIPMHTTRFAPVVEMFSPALDAAPWKQCAQTYWPNVSAAPIDEPDAGDFKSLLGRHVRERVLWRQTIDALDARFPDAIFIEVGPLSVVRNMITRRWIPKERVFSVDDPKQQRAFSDIVSEIRNARDRA